MTSHHQPARGHNAFPQDETHDKVRDLLERGYRLAMIAAHHDHPSHGAGRGAIRIVYVLVAGRPDRRVELHTLLDPTEPRLASLVAWSFPAGRFEREAADLFGVELAGHHQPARLVLHQHWPDGWHPMRYDAGDPPPFTDESTSYPFLTVDGTGVYEIPVGPVHAGIIEPGHFRFSVVGETILNMKARLWFVHKGIERLFQQRTPADGVELAERISGDTAVGHNLAYCLAVEEATDTTPPEPAQLARALLLELERIYNHITDLGAMANDVAYGIAHAHTMRLREQLLRLNQQITGHRLLRGGIVPGGTTISWLPDPRQLIDLRDDLRRVVDLTLANTTVVDRFTGTATLHHDDAAQMRTLGYVARASGVDIDARRDHPFTTAYDDHVPVVLTDGDVMARYRLRVLEIEQSIDLITTLLGEIQPGRHVTPILTPSSTGSGVGLAEGWRGTICHRVELGPDGRLTRVKVVDPSWFNWPALPVALAGDTIVPDFPLANKSFNLSYAGNDL